MLKIEVKFKEDICQDFEKIQGKSDWIDLRSAEDVELKKFDFYMIELGFAAKLPDGYEAHVLPRSSTYKNFGIIQANSMGIIDNSYQGNEDYWKYPVIALRDTTIKKGDRICQFRIIKKMDETDFVTVKFLKGENRGGFGSTGLN